MFLIAFSEGIRRIKVMNPFALSLLAVLVYVPLVKLNGLIHRRQKLWPFAMGVVISLEQTVGLRLGGLGEGGVARTFGGGPQWLMPGLGAVNRKKLWF